jgi:hypothetical protein
VPIAGAARGFSMQSPARELEPITLDLDGQPGDLAGVFWGLQPATLFKQNLHGAALLDFSQPTFLIVIGALPPDGQLSLPLAFEDLGPGWEGIALPFQAIYKAATGPVFMAAPAMSVVLDEAQ